MLFKPQPWQKQVSLFKVKVQNHLKKAFPRLLYPAAAAAHSVLNSARLQWLVSGVPMV